MVRKVKKNKYKGKKFYKIVPPIIFGLAGVFFAAVPHAIRQGIGLDFDLDPQTSVIFGIVLIIIAGILYWKFE